MAASPGCTSCTEPPMVEQVITEFFAKSLHIILESRSPYVSSRNYNIDRFVSSPCSSSGSHSPSSSQPRDKWFNLALRDCPAALENFDLWRQSNLEPLVIDIVLLRRAPSGRRIARSLSGKDGLLQETEGEKVVERWIIRYESRKSGKNGGRETHSGTRKSKTGSSYSAEDHRLYRKTYKGSIVLLRSLYLVVRLLPAYNLFRELNSSGQFRPLSLSHKISTFVEPFTRAEDAELYHFAFAPIETPFGRLNLSVSYIPTLEVVAPEPSTPLSTDFIVDYVGSPTTDFLKRFQLLPSGGVATPHILATRRHSWSIDHGAVPSVLPSPSPTYSESHAVHYNESPRLQPRSLINENSLTACSHPNNALSGNKKHTSSEENYPSLPWSPSPTPSPPAHVSSGGHLKNTLLRSESAPGSIPNAKVGVDSGQLPPPSLKGKHSCSSQNDSPRAQVPMVSPDGKPPRTRDLVRLVEFESEKALQKVLSFGKDDFGDFHGLKLLSRTSSRPTLWDELDDSELVFAGDERDIIDQLNRMDIAGGEGSGENPEVVGSLGLTRSPAAAVGALVRMLKVAPGLRENLGSVASPQTPRELSFRRVVTEESDNAAAPSSAMVAPGLLRSRTAADALEELSRYKETRDSILSRGTSRSVDTH